MSLKLNAVPISLFAPSDDNKSAAVPSYLFMRIPSRYCQTAKRTLKYSQRVASSRPSIFYGDDIESRRRFRQVRLCSSVAQINRKLETPGPLIAHLQFGEVDIRIQVRCQCILILITRCRKTGEDFVFPNDAYTECRGCLPGTRTENIYRWAWSVVAVGSRSVGRESIELQLSLYSHRSRRRRRRNERR